MKQFWSFLSHNINKLLPSVVLLSLLALAGGTNIFTAEVRKIVSRVLYDYLKDWKPIAINLLTMLILFNVAWMFYSPLFKGLKTIINKTGASISGKISIIKICKILYWITIILVIFAAAASDILNKFAISIGVFGAALAIALQGIVNDMISGLLIQICRKISDDDEIIIEGLDVKGKVIAVGYLSSIIENDEFIIRIPSREIWGRAIKILKRRNEQESQQLSSKMQDFSVIAPVSQREPKG